MLRANFEMRLKSRLELSYTSIWLKFCQLLYIYAQLVWLEEIKERRYKRIESENDQQHRSLPISRGSFIGERLRFFQKNGRRGRASDAAGRRKAHRRTKRNLKGHPTIHLSMRPLTRRLFVRRDQRRALHSSSESPKRARESFSFLYFSAIAARLNVTIKS